MLAFEIFSLDDNYLDWMITTQLDDNYQEVVIIQWYCSYHPVLSFDVWLHWNRIIITNLTVYVCIHMRMIKESINLSNKFCLNKPFPVYVVATEVIENYYECTQIWSILRILASYNIAVHYLLNCMHINYYSRLTSYFRRSGIKFSIHYNMHDSIHYSVVFTCPINPTHAS